MKLQKLSSLNFPHKKQYRFELTQKVSFCINCSTAIIKNKTGSEVSTIKPLKYHLPQENSFPIFLVVSDYLEPYKFFNKSGYIKIRKEVIKSMKLFCDCFKLDHKTFFLALDYLDRICSKMLSFDVQDIKQISQICIVLAAKLQDNQIKEMELKKLTQSISRNYKKDELFILSLLNHELCVFTSYDILMDILKCGFFFNDEDFSIKKMHSIYGQIENILYLFSESKYYIEMTHKEVAMAIIGFVRETLGLVAFSENIQIVFMDEYTICTHKYLSCLNKLRKCFKFKVDQNINSQKNGNHSDSNTDCNSDNNSENISDNN
jgi:hypothetical protein